MLVIGIIDDRANLSPVWRIVALTFIVFTVFSIIPLFVLHTLRFGLFGSDFSVPLAIRSPHRSLRFSSSDL